ncbi:MAG: carboxypeptidase-like regulatory domain-containing protein [Actinomycetota bacterium]
MAQNEEIGFERLVDWLEGRLSEEEGRKVERRVEAAGEATLAEVEFLRAFYEASEETVLEEPPERLRGELERRFEEYAGRRRHPGPLRRLVAALAFDSGLQAAAAGVRSASIDGAGRQLIYTTDVADIALNVRSRRGRRRLDLEGQVLPGTGEVNPGSFSVRLLQETSEVETTGTDDLGEFAFEDVAPGSYELLVSTGDVEIVISPIELEA